MGLRREGACNLHAVLEGCVLGDQEGEAILTYMGGELAAPCSRTLCAVLAAHRPWVCAYQGARVASPEGVEGSRKVGEGRRE